MTRVIIRRRLSSTDITPPHQYYAAIRLPACLLAPLLCIACRPYSLAEERQGLPSCRDLSMYSVPRSLTPEEFQRSCLFVHWNVAFCWTESIGLLNIDKFRGSIPSTFRLSAHCLACLRLNRPVTRPAPRLASRWLARPSSAGFPPAICHDLAWSLPSPWPPVTKPS